MPALLEIRDLTKRYPGVIALDRVELTLDAGHIHALVGENGAGKSTLIRILAGVERADAGLLRLDGAEVAVRTPIEARRARIAVVHQQPHLIPELSVMENLALRGGYPLTALGTVAWRGARRAASEACAGLIPSLDVRRSASALGGAEQTLVELSFALAARPRLLILDEPTAALPRRESERLFERLRALAADGTAVLLVTHRLDEVFGAAHDVTVLRDGRRIWSRTVSGTGRDELIRAMVGRSVELERDDSFAPADDQRLVSLGLSDRGGGYTEVNVALRRGEIYGIYGLVDSGASALCKGLFGLRPTAAGEALADGARLPPLAPLGRVRAGVAYVAADRHAQGNFPQLSVSENLALTRLAQLGRWAPGDRRRERAAAEAQIDELGIKTRGPAQPLAQLSGGNQQKVLLGRWIRTQPRVLILEEPTQGVDVGAKRQIHGIVRSLAKKGISILLVSSELPELLALSHRIGVMREGRLVAERDARRAGEEELLRLSLPERRGGAEPPAHAGAVAGVLGALRWLAERRETALAALLVTLALGLAATLPGFATWTNARDVLLNNAILLVGALGMTAVIIAGGIDISAGAILGLAATAAALADGAGWPGWAIALAAPAAGAALGAANGALSVLGRVHSIVITLGTLSIYRGLIIQVTGGRMLINLSDAVTWLRHETLGGVPLLLLASLASLAAAHVFLSHLPAGRRLYALGGDPTSAAYLGVRPRQVLPLAFAIAGGLAGLAGLMWASRFGQVQGNVGQGFELAAIAAAVLGGAHIAGGRGSALGTFLGATFMGVATNALVLSGVSAFWERAIVGGMILLALAVDRLAPARRPA